MHCHLCPVFAFLPSSALRQFTILTYSHSTPTRVSPTPYPHYRNLSHQQRDSSLSPLGFFDSTDYSMLNATSPVTPRTFKARQPPPLPRCRHLSFEALATTNFIVRPRSSSFEISIHPLSEFATHRSLSESRLSTLHFVHVTQYFSFVYEQTMNVYL